MLCNYSLRPNDFSDYITAHFNSNRALSYNKALKSEIYYIYNVI